MTQKEFDLKVAELNAEYAPQMKKITDILDIFRKQNAEIAYKVAQLNAEKQKVCMSIRDNEALLKNLNREFHAKRNELKLASPDNIFTMDDMLYFARYVSKQPVTKDDYREYLNQKLNNL